MRERPYKQSFGLRLKRSKSPRQEMRALERVEKYSHVKSVILTVDLHVGEGCQDSSYIHISKLFC